MFDFIKNQYEMYKKGLKSIGIDKINALSIKWLTQSQKEEIFSGNANTP